MSFIKIENLGYTYNNYAVLSNLTFTIHKNDFISLLGPSGAGKSTILKILAKILRNYNGNIFINSVELKNYNNCFAYMPQNHLLLPWKTVLDNLCVPLIILGNTKKTAVKIISSYIDEFELSNILNRYPHEISGGQKQRIALLRSILLQSNFLLLDEPFSQLDTITKSNLQNFLKTIYQKYNYTILFVTHDIDEAIILSNKIYIMNKNGNIYKDFVVNLPKNNNDILVLDKKFLDLKTKVTKTLLEINQ